MAGVTEMQTSGYVSTWLPPAQLRWWYDTARGEGPELFCYTTELSVPAGDPIALRVHTTAASYDIVAYRDGTVADIVHLATGVPGTAQPTRPVPYRDGCGWEETLTIDTDGWRPGPYVIVLTAEVEGLKLRHAHWIALRPPRLSQDRLTLIAATSTWNAYNGWGGSSSYHGIDGPEADQFSPVLSLHRPWQAGFIWLPEGAPRNSNPPQDRTPHVHYPWFDWAFSRGYGKHFSSGGWASFDRHFVAWAERNGYAVDVLTQHDLHFRPDLLRDAGPLVFAGHDEYWSAPMRDHLDDFVVGGGQVARLAGNFLWQVRLSDDGSQQTCYKGRAVDEDPVREDPGTHHLTTHAWDHAAVGRPGATTFGCTASRGIYASLGGLVTRASGGFTIYRPDHWMLAGTASDYGDVLGMRSRVATYELDGLDYVIRNGLPFATGEDGIDPDRVEIVGLCPASNIERDHGIEGSELGIGAADAASVAEIRYGEVTPETLERASRGCGVMAEYRNGRGRVVSAAAAEWVNGLRLDDADVTRVTRNILDELLRSAA